MKNIRCAVSELTAFSILLTFLVSTAVFAVPNPPEPPAITEFKFEVQFNTGKIQEDIVADIYGDSLIVGIIPYQLADFSLKATFLAGSGETVKVNGVDQVSTITANDFSTPVTYVASVGATTRTYKVRLVYTGLPLIYIYTENAAPILNREDYVNGTIKIYPNVDTLTTYIGAMGIRGRGNTTWTLPKKPYRIKLGTAASLLGMPSDKDWVLLANHSDKTLMRNSLAYDLGAQMNFRYTHRSTHVDVVLNGAYQGSYVLGEHIKVDKDRVNIKELEEGDVDPETITGGYFLELDDYRDGLFFELASGLPFVVKSPDDIPQAQLDYIRNYMQETEDVIFSSVFADPDLGYAKYINPETFIEWYWVNEVLKNIDARDGSSIFYYKDRGEKLNMGPLWDLDVAAGNASVLTGEDPTSFYVRESTWFKRLFEDPAFKSAAEARWFTFKDELLVNLPELIDGYADKLKLSQELNFYKWDILNQPIWPSPVVLGSYEKEVDYLKDWMSTRIAWIDAQIPQPELISFNLTSPVNGTRVFVSPGYNGHVKFSWTPSTNGSSYQVLMDRVEGDFSNKIIAYPSDSNSLDTIATIAVSDLYTLFDQVTDKDSITLKWTAYATRGGKQAVAQETFMINLVNGVIGIPSLHSPVSNATVEDLNPVIKWHKTYLAKDYDVQVSPLESFETLVVDKTGLVDTVYAITEQLTEQTKYYWRTRSVNGGKQSNWSETRSFTTSVITGVGELAYGVSMFPNPTSRELFIEIPSLTLIENAILVDALGRTAVSSELLPGATTRIDVSNLQRGMYVVILRGKIDKPVMRKIVLR
jgi:hypothetical protein